MILALDLTPITSSLRLLGRETARIVLPAPCVVCRRELPWSERRASCCAPCWQDLPAIARPKCSRCSTPFASANLSGAVTCIACLEAKHSLEWIEAWGEYRGGLEKVLHAFKFERHDFLAGPLAALLNEALRTRGAEFDAITPVPMRRSKIRKRGYNQAELLSRNLARTAGLPHRPELLRKTRENASQSTLPRAERHANVRSAFDAPREVAGLSILLVDDICTTGETLEACASALLRSGARRVSALVVARA